MAPHDSEHGGEAQAGSLPDTLGGEEWIINFFDDLLRDATAGIGHFQDHIRSGMQTHRGRGIVFVDVEVGGGKCKTPAVAHGITRVDAEVQEQLMQLGRIGFE